MRRRSRPRQRTNGPSGVVANAGALLVSRLVIAVLGWLGTVLIVRTLSVEDFGRFTLIFSVLGALSIVTDLGIGRIAVAGLIEDRRDRAEFAGSYILLRSVLGVLGYLLAVAFVVVAGYDQGVVAATAVAATVVVLATPARAYETVFEAHRRMQGVAVARAFSRIAQLALVAALAAAGGSLLLFVLPAVLTEVVMLVWVAPAAHRLIVIRYRVVLSHWWGMLREAAPLAVAAGLATIYYRVDSIMLSQLDTFTSVAIYGVAYKFVDLAHFVPEAVTAAILPLLVAAWPDRTAAFAHTVQRAATILLLVAAFIVVEFTLFAEPLIELLYGRTYAVGADAARVVVLSQCLTFATALCVCVLIATGRHRRYPLITLTGLVLNVGLNLVLIPRLSYQGAAAAILATDVVVAGLMLAETRRVPGLRPLPRPPVLRVLGAGGLGAAAGWVLARVLPWPLAALGSIVVLGVAAWALRAAGPLGWRGLLRDPDPANLPSDRPL